MALIRNQNYNSAAFFIGVDKKPKKLVLQHVAGLIRNPKKIIPKQFAAFKINQKINSAPLCGVDNKPKKSISLQHVSGLIRNNKSKSAALCDVVNTLKNEYCCTLRR